MRGRSTLRTIAVWSGLLLRLTSAADSGVLQCDTQADCPKCSLCEPKSLEWQKSSDSWGECVYDEDDDLGCPRDSCNVGICTGINECGFQDRPDQKENAAKRDCADSANTYGGVQIRGLHGERIRWRGEDDGWYALLSDAEDTLITARVTSPASSGRQRITGFAVKYKGGHSIIIEIKHPHTTETDGCLGVWFAPCLAENSLRVVVDGTEHISVPIERASLPGNGRFTAVNLPAECQPHSSDNIGISYAKKYTPKSNRYLRDTQPLRFGDWGSGWVAMTVAPRWCAEFFEEAGIEGALEYNSKNAVFRIETPAMVVRLHSGTNRQYGAQTVKGRAGGEFASGFEHWEMAIHLEYYHVNAEMVTGIVGEAMRPVAESKPLSLAADGVFDGNVEDYRISGPLDADSKFFNRGQN